MSDPLQDFKNEMDKSLFGQTAKEGQCIRCKKEPIEDSSFRDEASRREFHITHMCQDCQDFIYSSPEKEEEIDIDGYLVATLPGSGHVMSLSDGKKTYYLIFSDEEAVGNFLRSRPEHPNDKNAVVGKIESTERFLEAAAKKGVGIFIDAVFDGDSIKTKETLELIN